MSEVSTVLVLGAGVSRESRMPSGAELVEHLTRKSTGRDALLHRALVGSRPPSIDAFLESSERSTRDSSAVMIQEILMELENQDALMQNSFFKNLFYVLRPVDYQKVKIITFNYDRCLEAYLDSHLENVYRYDDRRKKEVLSQLEIFHVHGQCCPIPIFSNDRTPVGLRYGASLRDQNLSVRESLETWAIQNIKFVFDDREGEEKVGNWLKKASQIFFLGFGYDMRNLDTLDIKGALSTQNSSKIIAGTGFELGRVRQQQVRRMIPGFGRFFSHEAAHFFDDGYHLLDFDLNRYIDERHGLTV